MVEIDSGDVLAPDVFEGFGRHRGVAHGISDARVAKEVLEPPGIHAFGRQRVAGAMAQHMDMNGNGSFAVSPALSTILDCIETQVRGQVVLE
jgi:hypothetical protein